jgi:hypothetical protein
VTRRITSSAVTATMCSIPARGMDVCLCVVLSCVSRGLCNRLITRPKESYHVCLNNTAEPTCEAAKALTVPPLMMMMTTTRYHIKTIIQATVTNILIKSNTTELSVWYCSPTQHVSKISINVSQPPMGDYTCLYAAHMLCMCPVVEAHALCKTSH